MRPLRSAAMDFNELGLMIIRGDHRAAAEWTQSALNAGVPPQEVIDNGLVPGMDEVGRRFKNNEFHMPEVLIAARAMKASMALLRPLVAKTGARTRGRVVLGTVQGDLHDIGKNMVGMMLEGAGFEVHDLGTDVSPEKFRRAIEEKRPDLIGMSALLTTTMPMIGRTIEELQRTELRQRVKVMVGGAPVSQEFSDQIGADGYAPDSASAVELAKALMQQKQ
jgi:5-methyltetrahydrofolate--homocysteine methyltransferase